jgi:O-antigen/teichoic acid export membrane protein
MLSGPLLPLSARLDEANNRDGAQRLVGSGLTLVLATTMPIFAGGVLYSEEILRIWIGPELTHFAGWLSALFAMALLLTIIGFGQTTLLVRPAALRALNVFVLGQLVLTFAVGLSLVGWLAERAFILGQVVAVATTFPIQVAIIARKQRLNLSGIGYAYAKIIVAGLPVAAGLHAVRGQLPIGGPLSLGATLGAFMGLYWLTLYLFTLTPRDRNIVRRVVTSSASVWMPRPVRQS